MISLSAPLAALLLAVAPVAPPAPVPPTEIAPPEAPRPATVRVVLQTGEGVIALELEKERAPATTANFLRYVDQKRLDGVGFYRAMKLTPDGSHGLVQAGVRGDTKRLLPPVKHEATSATGLSHVDGAISMARAAPGSAAGDFFIMVGDVPGLDANPAATGDKAGFAVFGRVVEGMDVVRRILDKPTSPTEGVGVMKGQMLAAPVRITTARRAPK